MARSMAFIGISTAQSSMMKIFPAWRDLLGLGADLELTGCDLPLHASARQYRDVVVRMKGDSSSVGGLVTTHKIDLYRAAADLFDELDAAARMLGEISAIARRNGRLLGYATDPISAGRTLDDLLGPDYFARTGAHTLLLGGGGAGTAIMLYLLARRDAADRPQRVIVVDADPDRLANLKGVAVQAGFAASIECVLNRDPRVNDALVGELPPGSLVANATGMGKDTPGAPVTTDVLFPLDGVVWDLNYRGQLDFMSYAMPQRAARRLRVEDGWQYFIYGWAAVLEKVFDRFISREELTALGKAAAPFRPAPAGLSQERG
ncbi:MAG TPA: shikimate dehydrogenase [Chloroflexota bacterium]